MRCDTNFYTMTQCKKDYERLCENGIESLENVMIRTPSLGGRFQNLFFFSRPSLTYNILIDKVSLDSYNYNEKPDFGISGSERARESE